MAVTLAYSLEIPFKWTYHIPQQLYSWELTQKNEDILYRSLYTNVRNSFIHNSQKRQTT